MFRYDEALAQVKGLENQAIKLSGEARDESKMAAVMLKDITNMERGIPSPLEVEIQSVLFPLSQLHSVRCQTAVFSHHA